jgi:uncharacterized DUF497 family protein
MSSSTTAREVIRRKHGVSFETAVSVFDDSEAVSYLDRVIDGEERWHTLGLVDGIVMLVVHQLRNKMAKKKSAWSRQEKRVPANALFTKSLSDRQRRELQRLRDMPDSEIGFSDAPERDPLPAEVHVGRFYRPIEMQARPRGR